MTDSMDSVEAGSFEQELFELIARYEDDVLDQVGLAKLNELLVGSAKARDIFNDVCLQSLTIGEALSVEVDAAAIDSRRVEPSTHGRQILSFPRWIYSAAAAVVVLLATTYYLTQRETPSLNPDGDNSGQEILTEPLVARLQSQSGGVELFQADGTPIEGMEFRSLEPGMAVATRGPDSSTVLVYPDGTRIELGPNTSASLADVDRKLVLLERGDLRANVQSQPTGKPFGVRTPHLELTVVGTEFLVTADDDDTSIRVFEGHVQVERLSDQSQVELVAGQEVAVAREGELLVASLPPSSPKSSGSVGSGSSTSGESNEPPAIDLKVNQRTVQGVATLGRPAILRGRAVDANGNPYSNAKVSLHANKNAQDALAETTTDSQGRFEIQVGVYGELVARVGSAIEAKVVATSGQVSDLGDLAPDAK
ncbi:MAG: FecR domain-containing protein [Opitutales bacterium]